MWFRVTSMSIHSGQRVEKRADVAAEGSHASAVCDFPLNDRSLSPVPLPPQLCQTQDHLRFLHESIQTSTQTFHPPPLFYPSSSVDDPFCAEDRDDSKKRNRYESFHLVPFFAANALILSIFIRKGLERGPTVRGRVTSNVCFQRRKTRVSARTRNESFIFRPTCFLYIYIRNERVRTEIIPNDNGEILVSRLV